MATECPPMRCFYRAKVQFFPKWPDCVFSFFLILRPQRISRTACRVCRGALCALRRRRKVRAAQSVPLLNGKSSARANQCRRKQPPSALGGKGEKVGQEPTSRMVTYGLCTSGAESSRIPAAEGCSPDSVSFGSGTPEGRTIERVGNGTRG